MWPGRSQQSEETPPPLYYQKMLPRGQLWSGSLLLPSQNGYGRVLLGVVLAWSCPVLFLLGVVLAWCCSCSVLFLLGLFGVVLLGIVLARSLAVVVTNN